MMKLVCRSPVPNSSSKAGVVAVIVEDVEEMYKASAEATQDCMALLARIMRLYAFMYEDDDDDDGDHNDNDNGDDDDEHDNDGDGDGDPDDGDCG